MSKRASGQFGRRAMDHYPTPAEAVLPLIPHLTRTGVRTFAEPCCAEGQLIQHLEGHGFTCTASGDLAFGEQLDARGWAEWDYNGADVAITNPPWERFTMMGIMEHQSTFVPGWFLIYSDWLFTKQSAKLMTNRCTDIVPIGRVKWFPESTSVGYDNCCWIRLSNAKQVMKLPTVFWPFSHKEVS
jgi:hypothetical protein